MVQLFFFSFLFLAYFFVLLVDAFVWYFVEQASLVIIVILTLKRAHYA